MMRIVAAAILGIVVGATAAHSLVSRTLPNTVSLTPFSIGTERAESGSLRPAVGGVSSFSDRVEIHRFARQASPAELTSAFEEAAEQPASQEHRFELGVLISRLAELDPDRALVLLADQDLDDLTARVIGLLVLESVGTTTENIANIVAALPQLDGSTFQVSAIARLATRSPDQALQLAYQINNIPQRTLAVREIAYLMAEQDPHAALRYSASMPAEPGVIFEPAWLVFEIEALRHLAQTDLPAAIEYFNQDQRVAQSQNASQRLTGIITDAASELDPATALELATRFEGYGSESIERAALRRLTQENPVAALSYIDGMPAGPQRDQMRRAVVEEYGEVDPEGALAWARSLDPMPSDVVSGVLESIARQDPLRALDLLLAGDLPLDRRWGGFGVINAVLESSAQPGDTGSADGQMAEIGDRLLALDDDRRANWWLEQFVSSWSGQDAVAALDWLNLNQDGVSNRAFTEVAQSMAEVDPAAALRYSSQLRQELRDDWVEAVAGQVANSDTLGAVEWIAQFRGETVYDSGAAAVARAAMDSYPEQAVALFDTLNYATQLEASQSLAGAWARESSDAARDWILAMPPGAIRDSALGGFISARDYRRYTEGVPSPLLRSLDPATLALFSSDTARQEAVVELISSIAHSDEAAARGLMNQYLTDPLLISRAEQRMRWAQR